jgi:mono/diheme cytochrome c family protein
MRDRMQRIPVLTALTLGMGLGLAQGAVAQTMRSVWDGVYSEAQATRGRGQYGLHCAVCHGKALEGSGEAPPMTGELVRDWAGLPLSGLFEKVAVTMPLNRPGRLSAEANADILAFLLKANNFPSGSDLPSDMAALAGISLDAVKPVPAKASGKK